MGYVIRELQARDIYSLNKMYDSLSDRSKLFLHLGYLGFESIGSSWFQVQVSLLLSSMKVVRKILKRLCPFLIFFSLVMTTGENDLIGFSLLKLKGHLEQDGLWGELVMGVKDGYQGKGLGSKLMTAVIGLAKSEGVEKIFLSALKSNVLAVSFYEKHGFRIVRVVREGARWRGRRYDNVEMWLDTPVLNPRYDTRT